MALFLRARDLAATPTSGDEAESAINALTIAQHGVPRADHTGLPTHDDTLAHPAPDHPEHESRDGRYSKQRVVIYHGWPPLSSMWASQRMYGVVPDEVAPHLRVRHSRAEVRRRVVAARAPSLVFGMA